MVYNRQGLPERAVQKGNAVQALITGAEGFAGGHLTRHLRTHAPDLVLHGTVRPGLEAVPAVASQLASLTVLDLKDSQAVVELVDQTRPAFIYHLAAQAFVPRSFEDPWETLENNIRAQLNVILALLALDLRPRLLVVSSAEIYGMVTPDDVPITEDHPLRPTNPYSVSKVAQDMLGLQYHLSHQLPVIRVRSFNHIGPGQGRNFAASSFAMQIAQIEQGLQEPVLHVGNLTPQRDFTDVRDVVSAYQLALEKGKPGAVYNVCSGHPVSIQHLLSILIGLSAVPVEVRQDPARMRPVDQPLVVGSAARLRADTGWQPIIPFEQSLHDLLEDCRARVRAS